MTAPVTRFDAERAVHLTLGAASPLWPAYFAAASSGVALWWLTRWTSTFVETKAVLAPQKPVTLPPQPIELTAVVELPTVEPAAPEPRAHAHPDAAPGTTASKSAAKSRATAPKPVAAASAPRATTKRSTPKA